MAKTEPFDNHFDIYEEWFVRNKYVYQSELKALQTVIPKNGKGLEIGVGSGLFAEPLGIQYGVEPSEKMRRRAMERGILVKSGVAENLPYPDDTFDYALMVTTICFVDNIKKSFLEAKRVIRQDGFLILGFVDADSPIGKIYLENKEKSLFYREATFFTTKQIIKLLTDTSYEISEIYQTVFGTLDEIKTVQETKENFGEGSFVVIKSKKCMGNE